jgi:hypothetical protein
MLAPIVFVWMRGGLLLLLAVAASGITLIVMNSANRRVRIEAAAAIGTCVVLYIWINFGSLIH